jgi:Outer membrane protein beta-barrel domain
MLTFVRPTGLLAAGAALIALGGSATAEENPSGFYIGAAYGNFNVEVENLEDVGDVIGDLDADDSAYKFFLGWRFNPYVAFEVDYIDLGGPRGDFEASGSSGDYELEFAGFAPYVYGTLPLGIFEIFGKVGYYIHDLEVQIDLEEIGSGEREAFESDDSGEAWVYGVGGGVTFIDHINAKIEYELMDLDNVEDAYTLWLSAAWRF